MKSAKILLIVLALFICVESSPIKYVVTLMFENRSFDWMFGFLKGVGKLTGNEFNYVNVSSKTNKTMVEKGTPWCTIPDPPHDVGAVGDAIYAPHPQPYHQNLSIKATMKGFVEQYVKSGSQNPAGVMQMASPDQVPTFVKLCQEFVCCDNFFSSVPGPTGPNRLFVHAGSSGAYNGGNWTNPPANVRTVFEQLHDEGYSFGIHYHDFETAFGAYPLFPKYKDNFIQDLGFQKFFFDIDTGNLKNYTFMVPLLGPLDGMDPSTMHPSFDFRPALELLKQVYEKLRSSKYWDELLFIVTFDEHGGFWDSVPPPDNVPIPDDQIPHPLPFDFSRVGVRIPTMFVSPWMPKTVDSTFYDLTSIPETIRKIFDLSEGPLTNRSRAANTFETLLLSKKRHDTPPTLPGPPSGPYCTPPAGSTYSGLAKESIDLYVRLMKLYGLEIPSLEKIYTNEDATAWLINASMHLKNLVPSTASVSF